MNKHTNIKSVGLFIITKYMTYLMLWGQKSPDLSYVQAEKLLKLGNKILVQK